MFRYLTIAVLSLVTLSCAGTPASAPTAGAPQAAPVPLPSPPVSNVPPTEARLQSVLRAASLSDSVFVLDSLDIKLGEDFGPVLARIAYDRTQPPIVRGNALLILGDRGARGQMYVFAQAITDSSVLVRTFAAAGLHNILIVGDSMSRSLLFAAMHDRDDRVQVKALESVGDHDPALLRTFLSETPGPSRELRILAEQLVQTAEDRGAALVPAADGSYERTSHGVRIRFEPTKRYPQWHSAVGVLRVGKEGQALDSIAADVEVVSDVVPAFVSNDGRYLVFEAKRLVYVRDLDARSTRTIGPATAPRALPFTDSFMFARENEKSRTEHVRGGTEMFFHIFRAPFASAAPVDSIGQARAIASGTNRGGYAPIRWARIIDYNGELRLEADSLSSFKLPDPFGTGRRKP